MSLEFTVHREVKPVWFAQALINMAKYGTIYYSDDAPGEFHKVDGVGEAKLHGYRPDENRSTEPEENDGWVWVTAFNHDTYFKSESWYPVGIVETSMTTCERKQLNHVIELIQFGDHKEAVEALIKILKG